MNDTVSFGPMRYQLKGQQSYKNISPNTSLTNTFFHYSRLHVLALVLMLGEEFFALLDVGLDGVTSWLPAGGTNCKEKSTMNL